jgi:hypothetical protein
MSAPYVFCSQCQRRLCGYRSNNGGYHVLPHNRPTGGVCPGRLFTDHQLERPVIV